MKTFRVELKTKYAFDTEISKINLEDIDVDNLSKSQIFDLLDDSEYIQYCGLGDEWDGQFSLKVYDENKKVIYKNDDFEDFNSFINSERDVTDDNDLALVKPYLPTIVERWKHENVEPGEYIVAMHQMKVQKYSFIIEAESFDSNKLFFIGNQMMQGLTYDYMSDPNHIFYDGKFLIPEPLCDCEDVYGTRYYLAKREEGWFEILSEIDV